MSKTNGSTPHGTPMLDQLEDGPWSSFVSGIKRLRDQHPSERVNDMANDHMGQLEHSYETRKSYWKGGTVSVYGYGGGIVPRFSEETELPFTKYHIDNWRGSRKSLNASSYIRF